MKISTRLALLVFALSPIAAHPTAHVVYVDGDTIYIANDSLRTVQQEKSAQPRKAIHVCKFVAYGNSAVVLTGTTTTTHVSASSNKIQMDNSFYDVAAKILRKPESFSDKFKDLQTEGSAHLRLMMKLHPERKNTSQGLTLAVTMIAFENGVPKSWSYWNHVGDWRLDLGTLE